MRARCQGLAIEAFMIASPQIRWRAIIEWPGAREYPQFTIAFGSRSVAR
jgi:hypothetical protein